MGGDKDSHSRLSSLTSFTNEEIEPFSLKRGNREAANATLQC